MRSGFSCSPASTAWSSTASTRSTREQSARSSTSCGRTCQARCVLGRSGDRPGVVLARELDVFRLSEVALGRADHVGAQDDSRARRPSDTADLRRRRGPKRHPNHDEDPTVGRLRDRGRLRAYLYDDAGMQQAQAERFVIPVTTMPTRWMGTRSTARSTNCSITRGSITASCRAVRVRSRRRPAGARQPHASRQPGIRHRRLLRSHPATCASTTSQPSRWDADGRRRCISGRPAGVEDPDLGSPAPRHPFPSSDHRLVGRTCGSTLRRATARRRHAERHAPTGVRRWAADAVDGGDPSGEHVFGRPAAAPFGVDDALVNPAGTDRSVPRFMGRRVRPQAGPWTDDEWCGWWGDEPPFETTVFVMTHYPRPTIDFANGTLLPLRRRHARRSAGVGAWAAGGKDVQIGGGPTTVREFLSAGLVDVMQVVLVPLVLGRGVSLWRDSKASKTVTTSSRSRRRPRA